MPDACVNMPKCQFFLTEIRGSNDIFAIFA